MMYMIYNIDHIHHLLNYTSEYTSTIISSLKKINPPFPTPPKPSIQTHP